MAARQPKPASLPAKSLMKAIEGGDYLEILYATRRDIVTSLPNERGQALAAMHYRLFVVSQEIYALETFAAAGSNS